MILRVLWNFHKLNLMDENLRDQNLNDIRKA